MQKIKYLLPLFILPSFYLQAAETVPAAGAPAAAVPDPSSVPRPAGQNAAGQDPIVRALQDDIVFEREKRQLSNELALEKLRAELQKVRGDSAPAPVMPVTPPPAMPVVVERSEAPAPQVAPPAVVLVSQVAGVSRVALSVNGQLRFVGRHETFTANGKKYRLVAIKNDQLVAREVK
ncbi:TPA: hypothetical protein I8Y21_002302 [Klebsiella oxytoca]|uniref:LngG n=1 Tax=Klebsiella oxytoca TaxID=571 RepID=A0AAN5L8Q1_KLEOX|nr:hypothetical protein [Klebsiella oxytoca]